MTREASFSEARSLGAHREGNRDAELVGVDGFSGKIAEGKLLSFR